jgi:ABC-type multidrug transport system ATPase subunit
MLIIHKGQKVVEGTVNELLNPDDTLFEIQWTNIPPGLQENINNSIWQKHLVNIGQDSVEFKMNPAQMPELNRWLVHSGANIIAIKAKHSLESYFLSLTNDTLTKN